MTFKGFDGHETVRIGDLLQDLIGAQDKQGQGSMMDCMQRCPHRACPSGSTANPKLTCPACLFQVSSAIRMRTGSRQSGASRRLGVSAVVSFDESVT